MHQNTEFPVASPPSSVIDSVDSKRARGVGHTHRFLNPDLIFKIIDYTKITRSGIPLPPPFVNIHGIDNVRTIGHFLRSPSVKIKQNLIYRSADLKGITEKGKTQFMGHGIKTVVDLRLEHDYDSIPGLPGVEWLSVPSEEQPPLCTEEIIGLLEYYQTSISDAFVMDYGGVLEVSGKVFELFFTHLRDKPNVPVLVHCSAGKDRTGLAIALLLKILGVDDYDIVHDYAQSSVGLGTAMPGFITSFGNNNEAYRENPTGLINFLSSHPDTMVVALVQLWESFGGAEKYLTTYTNLQLEDIEKIRKNLLVE